MNEKFITKIFLFLTNSPRFHYELIPFELHKKLGNNILFGTNLIKSQIQPNITINITGANPQIYPSAEQITHNHYYVDQFAEDAIKANKKEILLNQEEEVKKYITDKLYAILQDKKLYEETVKWAKTCSRPRDIKNRICKRCR